MAKCYALTASASKAESSASTEESVEWSSAAAMECDEIDLTEPLFGRLDWGCAASQARRAESWEELGARNEERGARVVNFGFWISDCGLEVRGTAEGGGRRVQERRVMIRD